MAFRFYLLAFALIFVVPVLSAQTYLVLDNYGRKRIRITEGTKIYFKLNGHKALYSDYIARLTDSTVVLSSMSEGIPLKAFSKFYFKRGAIPGLITGATSVGTIFLFSTAVSPLLPNRRYDSKETAVIGASLVATGQILRLLRWKKFSITDRRRIRVLNTSFR